jgi:hypothetical protein
MSADLGKAIREHEERERQRQEIVAQQHLTLNSELARANNHLANLRAVMDEKFNNRIGISAGDFGAITASLSGKDLRCSILSFKYNGDYLLSSWDNKHENHGSGSESSHGYSYSLDGSSSSSEKYFVIHSDGFGMVQCDSYTPSGYKPQSTHDRKIIRTFPSVATFSPDLQSQLARALETHRPSR